MVRILVARPKLAHIFGPFMAFVCLLCICTDAYKLQEIPTPRLSEEAVSGLSRLSIQRPGSYEVPKYGYRGNIDQLHLYETQLVTMHDHSDSRSSRALSTPSFSCQSMNETFNPYYMCSDIVDYDYYLPAGTTLDDLEATVRASVPASYLLLTGTCLSDYKKMMCARVFPPCVDNVVPDDSSTYVNGLPYKKPCASLCTTASYSGTTCAGILEGIGMTVNCTDTSIYDTTSSTSSGVCNALSNWSGVQVVSDRVETYNGTLCSGVIDTIYMFDPNMTAGVPGLPDLLPPGSHQGILEDSLAVLNTVPRWLQQDCMTDMRKVFCGATFLEPVATEALAPYGFGTVYVSKMPHYSLCSNYMSSCAVPLEAFFADIPAVHLDCNDTVVDTQGMVRVFPEATQVVGQVPLAPGLTVYLTSEPSYTAAADTYAITSQCPYGFADKGLTSSEMQSYTITMLADAPSATECVFECPTTFIPEESRATEIGVRTAFGIVSFLAISFSIFQAYNMWANEKGKLPPMWECYPVVFIWALFYWLSAVTPAPGQAGSPSCASDTVWFRFDTLGKEWSASPGNICMMQAIADVVSVFNFFYAFSSLVVELYLRVVRRVSDSELKQMKVYYKSALFAYHHLLPLIAFCMAGYGLSETELQEYSGITKMYSSNSDCAFTTGTMGLDFNLLWIPIVISYFVFLSLFMYTLGYCVYVTYRAIAMSGDDVMGKLWKTYKVLFLINIGTFLFSSNLVWNHYFGYFPGANVNIFANFVQLEIEILGYYSCLVSGFTSLEADPSGGAARCSSDAIERMMPVGNRITTKIVLATTISLAFIVPSINKHSNELLWSMIPAPVQTLLMETIFAPKKAKVQPVENDDDEMTVDVEAAPMEKKVRPGSTVSVDEETKNMDV